MQLNPYLFFNGQCEAAFKFYAELLGGKRTILDGPFAESKEIVGGFFLIDCRTKEQAIAIANECPAAEWATIEVREVGVCFDDAN